MPKICKIAPRNAKLCTMHILPLFNDDDTRLKFQCNCISIRHPTINWTPREA